METPVKERLVGAVILVLLLAILVPELLSGPQQSKPAVSSDGQVTPLRTYTIDLSGQPSSPAKPAAVPRPVPAAPAGPSTPSPAALSTSTPEIEPEKAPASPSSAAAIPMPTLPPTPPTPTTVAAAPTATVAPSRAPASGSGWAVQLGSFSKSENAERLVKELKAKHYKAFVSRAGTGAKTRYRVRVGPEEDRAQAQRLAERLRREGRQVSIIPQP